MNKNRMESFSDGVFAIAITILVLEIKIPIVSGDKLVDSFVQQIPKILSFALSFFIIGMYWIAHHHMVHSFNKINRSVLWLNVLNLMFVCFLPYPTGLLGEYPFEKFSILIYALSLCLVNMSGTILWLYTTSKKELEAKINKKSRNYIAIIHMFPVLMYLISILVSNISLYLSYAIFVIVPLFFILPNRLLKIE